MDLHMKDKSVVITGGSSGIGKAAALELALLHIFQKNHTRILEDILPVFRRQGRVHADSVKRSYERRLQIPTDISPNYRIVVLDT